MNRKKQQPSSPTANTPVAAVEERLLIEARQEVGYADGKASFVLAALSIGFSALLAGVLSNNWRPSDLEGLIEVVWWLASVAAVVSVGFASAAIWPRLGDTSDDRPIYYWGQVAKLGSADELSTRLDKQPPGETARTRDQLWALSKLVYRKYWLVRIALTAGWASLVLFIVVGLTEL